MGRAGVSIGPRSTETQTPAGRQEAVSHQDPPEPLRWTTPTLAPSPARALRGRPPHKGCGSHREDPAQPAGPPAPGTAHSPGTCVVGPGSSFEEQLSSGPALHPSLPACSSGTRPREAPAEGRGPATLTAGPNAHQCPNLPTNLILTAQGTERAQPPPRRPVCPSLCILGLRSRPHTQAPGSQQGAAPPPALQGAPLLRTAWNGSYKWLWQQNLP